MLTMAGREMFLSADAEVVAKDLADLGAKFTSGYRDLSGQAYAMAVAVIEKPHWIGDTYKHGAKLQELVNAHPEWHSVEEIASGLYSYLITAPLAEVKMLSHHLIQPCNCFDILPMLGKDTYQGDVIKARISRWHGEGVIKQVLWKEGGLDRWHVEVADLPQIKVMEV